MPRFLTRSLPFFLVFIFAFFSSAALAQDSGFRSAYEAFLNKDYAGALARARAGGAAGPDLKDYERWMLGKSKLETGDFPGAIADLAAVTKDEPGSLLAPRARAALGSAYFGKGDFKKASEILQQALPTLSGDVKAEALYVLGQAELAAGDKVAAIAHWKQAYLETPGSSVEEGVLAKLESFQAATFSSEEKLRRANGLFDAKKYGKALEVYESILAGTPGDSAARVMKGECLFNLKRYGDAALYLEGAGTGLPAERARAARLHLGISLLRSQQESRALGALADVQSQYPGTPEGEEALYRIGMIYLEAGRFEEAGTAMERLAGAYAQGNFRDKGLWAVSWAAYKRSAWGEAKKFLQLMELGAADGPTQGKALYWLGRVFEKTGEGKQAQTQWTRAGQVAPYSYYGVLALKRLKGIESISSVPDLPPEWRVGKSAPAAAGGSGSAAVPSGDYHLKKALALYRIGLGKESLPEIAALIEENKGHPAALAHVLEAAKKSDAFYLSILLGQKYWEHFKGLFPTPAVAEDYRTGLLYPYAFRSLVETSAREFSLEPFLVVGLMRQESGFMPWAVSSANAQGLMQLLPSTAAPRARALGLSGYDLFDPADNIRLGTGELANMLSRFDGNWIQAFAAYNAGPGRARQWAQEFGGLPPDEFVEEIPFSETNLYVKLVLRNYWSYRLLYGRS
jgi:soluble lytic murein transglycosylase